MASLAGALALLAACNDGETVGGDDEVADTETGTESGSESGTESGESTTETETDTTESDTTETGQTEITVSGEVTDFFSMSGIANAEISVMGMPGFETTSDPNGLYSIAGMPPSTEVFFQIDGNIDTYWGGIRPAMLPATDIDDLELGQVANALIDLQLGLLQDQDPTVMADDTKAVVIARLLQPTATGAVVTFDPPLPVNTSYSVSAENMPVLNGNSIDSSVLPFWVAFNLDDDPGGAYTITVEHPERECEVLHPVFPTMGHYVTLIEVDCPPPP
ncbi:carboxypeptidase-like regulatory domain-containing protein [Nannocystaceae bacterium ST9]